MFEKKIFQAKSKDIAVINRSYITLPLIQKKSVNIFKNNLNVLTYQKSNNSFSTLNFKINPWFLTGFTDAEGSFIIKIHSNEQLKTKWRVRPVFSITLHVKDLSLLENIQKTLGVGKISKSKNLSAIYAVDSIAEIPIILDHFDKYPLITQKKIWLFTI